MSKPIKLSVSVVTYNHEQYLCSCLDSILSQITDFEYEIVVGEDCSTDNTRHILVSYAEKYPKKIKLILQKENVGAQRNFSDVVTACTGEYIAHIDGDDFMFPGKLQKQFDYLNAHPECVMVYHDMSVFDDWTGNTLYLFQKDYRQEISTLTDLIRYGTFFCHSSKMYRKLSVPKDGIDLSTCNVGDWLFHIQNAREGKIGCIDEVLGAYRKHGNSVSSVNKQRVANTLKDLEYTLKKAAGYVSDPEVIQYGFARIYYTYAWNYFELAEFNEFKRLITKSAEDNIFIDENHRRLFKLRSFPRLFFTVRKIKKYLTIRNA